MYLMTNTSCVGTKWCYNRMLVMTDTGPIKSFVLNILSVN